jgi:hypothetical protein
MRNSAESYTLHCLRLFNEKLCDLLCTSTVYEAKKVIKILGF